jgi:prevent-host-death family protein
MSDVNYIDSSKAREKFFDILDAVCDKKKVYVIRKNGKPVAKISCADEPKKQNLMKYAGLLTDKEAEHIKELIITGRRDGSHKKKYLLK